MQAQILNPVLNPAVEYEVVHATPERLRVRIPRLLDADYRDRLQCLVRELTGITDVRVNDYARSLIVQYDATQLGYESLVSKLELAIQEATSTLEFTPAESEIEVEVINPWQRLVLPTVGLSLAVVAAPLDVPILAVLLGTITLYSAVPMITNSIRNVLRGEVNGDTLESIWTVIHSWEGQFVAPNLNMAIAGAAETLRDATGERTEHRWRHLFPVEQVHVMRDGQECRILVEEVEPADTMVLYPGEMVAIDGTVLDGEGLLDVSSLKGELVPFPCCADDKIMAGSLVIEGKLWVRVDCLESDTEYVRELELGSASPLHYTEIAEYAEEVGKSLMVPSLAFSGLLLLATGDIARSLAPLQLDLATGISISAPTAVLSTIERARQSEIYVRAGYALETLTKADLVVFSKTGTLTEGVLEVVAVEPLGQDAQDHHPISQEEVIALAASELLALAASVKRGLRHPVAEAIVRHAETTGIAILPCEQWTHHRNCGLGVSAMVNGSQVLVGQRHYLASEGIDLSLFPAPVISPDDADVRGMWYVYVAKDGQLLGRIDCCDRLRPESRLVIAALRDRGLEVRMVTSNSQEVAEIAATALNFPLDYVHADLHPEAKVALIHAWQAAGKTVIYMGEGMDDYGAMRAADVAIGTHRSCPLNREAADLLLPDGDLTSLLTVLDLAQTAIAIIHQNIALIAIPNISAVALGIIFALNPIIAVIINQSVNLLAEVNGLRPLWGAGNRKSEAGAIVPSQPIHSLPQLFEPAK